MSKPREFWIPTCELMDIRFDKHGENMIQVGPNRIDVSPEYKRDSIDKIHVIEKSAYDAVVKERDAIKWPLSEASKQTYRRVFKSIDECQDFYCGYAKKLTAANELLNKEYYSMRDALILDKEKLTAALKCAKDALEYYKKVGSQSRFEIATCALGQIEELMNEKK